MDNLISLAGTVCKRSDVARALWLYLNSPDSTVRVKALEAINYCLDDSNFDGNPIDDQEFYFSIDSTVGSPEQVNFLEKVVRSGRSRAAVRDAAEVLAKIDPQRALSAIDSLPERSGYLACLCPLLYEVEPEGIAAAVFHHLWERRWVDEETVFFLAGHGRPEHRKELLSTLQTLPHNSDFRMAATWGAHGYNLEQTVEEFCHCCPRTPPLPSLWRYGPEASGEIVGTFYARLLELGTLHPYDPRKTREYPPPHDDLLWDIFGWLGGPLKPDWVQQSLGAERLDERIFTCEAGIGGRVFGFHFKQTDSCYASVTLAIVKRALAENHTGEDLYRVYRSEGLICGRPEELVPLFVKYQIPVECEAVEKEQAKLFNAL